jgi:hypothetical protein
LSAPRLDPSDEIQAELWVSLASLLRSYTAAHGLRRNQQAKITASEQIIVARNGEKWLRLERIHRSITWTRENGKSGLLELTGHGQLRGPAGEEAMDMAAEAWARELMLNPAPNCAKDNAMNEARELTR